MVFGIICNDHKFSFNFNFIETILALLLGDKPTWSLYIIILTHFGIQLAKLEI